MTENARVNSRNDARRLLSQRMFMASVVSTTGGLISVQNGRDVYPASLAAVGLEASVIAGDVVLCFVADGRIVVAFKVATS